LMTLQGRGRTGKKDKREIRKRKGVAIPKISGGVRKQMWLWVRRVRECK